MQLAFKEDPVIEQSVLDEFHVVVDPELLNDWRGLMDDTRGLVLAGGPRVNDAVLVAAMESPPTLVHFILKRADPPAYAFTMADTRGWGPWMFSHPAAPQAQPGQGPPAPLDPPAAPPQPRAAAPSAPLPHPLGDGDPEPSSPP